MQTSNPVFRNDPFSAATAYGSSMTVGGTVIKTMVLLALALMSGAATWTLFARGANVILAVMGAGLVGLLVALGVSFKPTWAAVLAPIYALLEGVLLGGISAIYNVKYPGIAFAAAGGTAATLAGLLFAYQTGIIRASDNFKRGVVAATLGIMLFYVATMVLGFFGIQMPGVFGSGWVGIGFSLFVVVIAALNLVLDFDFIENGARSGAPKYMEWYGAFGLMVTLVWLYLEILRLLSKLADRR
jgi:uncharacterized YccA/Bax inhibitor family protein